MKTRYENALTLLPRDEIKGFHVDITIDTDGWRIEKNRQTYFYYGHDYGNPYKFLKAFLKCNLHNIYVITENEGMKNFRRYCQEYSGFTVSGFTVEEKSAESLT